ncbi:MAG: sodium-independent anion transporter, partial [Bacteroidota bacterium]
HPELLIVRFDAQLYFANLQYFRDQMESLISQKGSVLRSIILSTESINHIDSSGIATLEEWTDDLKTRGIEVYFADVKGPLRDLFFRFGLTERLGRDHFFLSVQNAVDYFFEPEVVAKRRQKTQAYTLQRNEWRPRRLLRKKEH